MKNYAYNSMNFNSLSTERDKRDFGLIKYERRKPRSITLGMTFQNVGPPADLATSLRPLALRLPRKTPLMPSRAATTEHGVMRRVSASLL